MIAMGHTRTRLSILAATILIIVLIAGAWMFRLNREGAANLRSCGGLEPGGHRSDLMRTLGSPKDLKMNPARTRLVLFYQSPLFATRPIQVLVNVRDDVVMEIDCGDGRIRTYDKY
jgi:hypothetical protein